MNETYKPASHVAWRRIDEEIVVLNLSNSDYYSLNGVGARMWELLSEGHPAEKVAALVAQEYGAPPKEVCADVDEFLGKLNQERLLEPAL